MYVDKPLVSTRGKRSRSAAFTLLELIVVITIIGIIGTLVAVNVSGAAEKARRMKMESDCKAIYRAAKMIYTQTGYYPESITDMINPRDANDMVIPGGLEDYPKDPWGADYEYELREDGPVVTCWGKDGQSSGTGEDADFEYPETVDY